MKSIFKDEIEKTLCDVKKNKSSDDLCFVLLTDSHLSDQGEDTRENISALDKELNFDFIMHLGNVINGNNPEMISRYLLKSELEKYKNSIKSKKLFVSQGLSDGWRNERFKGQLVTNIITDKAWYEETSFIDAYPNVKRPGNKPYYYVDYPDKNLRLIVLCSYFYQIDEELELYEKYQDFSVEQSSWLIKDAFSGAKGKDVIIFSHRIAKSYFENGKNPFAYQGYSTERISAVVQQAKLSGVNIMAWFGGGYGFDAEIEFADIKYAVINSQLPSDLQVKELNGIRVAENRDLGTLNQECWDLVLLNQKEGKIRLYRFGCGEDRVI